MANICLVACAASKRSEPARAKELYVSALFQKSRALAEKLFDRWYILSAEHGLIEPDLVVAPYDTALNRMSRRARRIWAREVLRDLLPLLAPGDSVTLLAGVRYREGLLDPLQENGHSVRIPLQGLRIGEQLKWLDRELRDVDTGRDVHLQQFYDLLAQLEAKLACPLRLKDCHGRLHWPR